MAICFAAYVIYVLIHYLGGHPRAVVIHVIGALATGGLWALGTGQPSLLTLASHLNLGVATFVLSAHAWNGALLNDSAWFLALVPLLAAYQLGPRAAVTWTLFIVGILVLLPVLAAVYQPQSEWLLTPQEVNRNRVLLVLIMAAFGVASARATAEELERVRQTEKELKEANLKQAELNEALKRSNFEFQQFAHTAGHDLQAPLRRVRGLADLLQLEYGHALEQEPAEWLRIASEEVRQMQGLIQDLLAFASVDSERRQPEPVELSEVFERVITSLGPTLEAKNADIRINGTLPSVYSEPSLLSRLLQNLIENGIKYNESTPPVIELSAERSDEKEWTISVKDNGIGIEEASRPDVFEAFKRLHSTERYPGTGLGLAICQRIVRNQGGRLWLTSQLGQGSTFSFTVPAVPSDLESPVQG